MGVLRGARAEPGVGLWRLHALQRAGLDPVASAERYGPRIETEPSEGPAVRPGLPHVNQTSRRAERSASRELPPRQPSAGGSADDAPPERDEPSDEDVRPDPR